MLRGMRALTLLGVVVLLIAPPHLPARDAPAPKPGAGPTPAAVRGPAVVRSPGILPGPGGQASATGVLTPVRSGSGTRYQWPLRPTTVTRPFDPPAAPWLPGHRGVDLAGAVGAPVFAAGRGTVAFAGVVAGTPVVSIDHPKGLRTTYEPVQPLVRAGESVAGGQRIGTLIAGHPGCVAAACLHWGLRAGRTYLDPLALVGAARVRLYPVGGATPR